MTFILGVAVGAIVIGVIANRRPQWFAKVVSAANVADSRINDIVNKA